MTVRIHLANDFVLRSDLRNWIVSEEKVFESGSKAGETYYVDHGFYPKIPKALDAIADMKMRLSDAESFEELRKEFETFRKQCDALLTLTRT